MRKFVSLRGLQPVAHGYTRLVYIHPEDAGFLVKVLNPEFLARRRKRGPGFRPFKRARTNSVFLREIQEQLVLLARDERIDEFMPRIVGFCDTDRGVGMIVEAVRATDGGLAPSLKQLIRQGGFDEAARRNLDRFCEMLLDSDIVLTTLTMHNLVYGAAGEGERRFMLIDGFGNTQLIGWKGLSRSVNLRDKRRLIERMRRNVQQLTR